MAARGPRCSMRARARARHNDAQRRGVRMGAKAATCSVKTGRRLRSPNHPRPDRAKGGAILSESGSNATAADLPLNPYGGGLGDSGQFTYRGPRPQPLAANGTFSPNAHQEGDNSG